MTFRNLVGNNLRYFWRTHLAVVAGVAVAVGVLTGALVVGDSVRGSLRELFLSRLGRTDVAVLSDHFFRDALASEIATEGSVSNVPLIAFEGMVIHEPSGRRRTGVQVYGVDARFWSFHGAAAPELREREILLTASLATELGSQPEDTILLRVERPSEVPRGSLHGSKDDTGRTIRLTAGRGLEETGLSEFSIYPQQDRVRAVFVPLARLQRDLEQEDRVNAILLTTGEDAGLELDKLSERLRRSAELEDLTIRLRELPRRDAVVVESDALMLSQPVAETVRAVASAMGVETTAIFTYLANTLRVGEREVPYSLVAALDREAYASLLGERARSPESLVLNEWAATDLGASPGDSLTMEFYLWREEGRLETHAASFTVDAVIPMTGWGADPDAAPVYPGISESEDLSDWQPPFPIDLSRVRDQDEAYWDEYRTAAKAFIPLERGQEIWPVRQGRLTSIRLQVGRERSASELRAAFAKRLGERVDPLELGFTIVPVRAEGIEASQGATDFGEYFVYFSYFLVVAALLLTGLFFKLGVEQRLREVGTLLAMGFTTAKVRRVFLAEGLALAIAGGALGIAVALAYAAVILYGLRTWWVDAVGTRLLSLHWSWASLLGGVGGGILVAALAIALTLRRLDKIPVRSLLAGEAAVDRDRIGARRSRRAPALAIGSLVASLVLLTAAALGAVSDVAGFFGAGNLLLVSFLAFQWIWLTSKDKSVVAGSGAKAVSRLGFRNAAYRPGRSLVAIALIAFASFTIVAVDAFRKHDTALELDPKSGTGGYPLVAESLLPLHWDPETREGRDAFNLPYPEDPDAVELGFQPFRLRPGEDASCLNLYRPQNPRLLAPTGGFLEEGRFRFASALSETPEEEENPWLLLRKEFPDGAVPVIGDQNSMTYVLHLGLGEDFLLERVGEAPLRLRLVATLSDSIFQSELLVAEETFLEHFPGIDGFRYFLIETSRGEIESASALLERRLADFGFDVQSTAERLAAFHRVENTYLSTFQSLGGLGLVLGTFGLAAVLLRNALERRRELALLRAVGYESRDFTLMILAENALLVFFGLLTGSLSAVVAITPALLARGGSFGGTSLLALLLAVVASGILSSALAVAATLRMPLLASLRAE